VQDFTGIGTSFLPDSEAKEDDLGVSESRVDPKNILVLVRSPEIFGSDLNGCLSKSLPADVTSKTKGVLDCATFGDPMDCCLIRGAEGDPVFPLNKLDSDKRNDPAGLDSEGPTGTAGMTGPILDN